MPVRRDVFARLCVWIALAASAATLNASGTNRIFGCLSSYTELQHGRSYVLAMREGKQWEVKIDNRGCYEFKKLPPGEFRLYISDDRFVAVQKAIVKVIADDSIKADFSYDVPDGTTFSAILTNLIVHRKGFDLAGEQFGESSSNWSWHGFAANGDWTPKILVPDFGQCWLSLELGTDTYLYRCATTVRKAPFAKQYFAELTDIVKSAVPKGYKIYTENCSACAAGFTWQDGNGPSVFLTLSQNLVVSLTVMYVVKAPIAHTSSTAPSSQVGNTSSFPVPQVTYNASLGTMAQIVVRNNTAYYLTITANGPNSRTLYIAPAGTQQITISSGLYQLSGNVTGANVVPFSGAASFDPGSSYQYTFYIR